MLVNEVSKVAAKPSYNDSSCAGFLHAINHAPTSSHRETNSALATGVFLWRQSRQALVTFAVAVLMVMTRVSLVEYQDGGWAYVAIVVVLGAAVNGAIFAYLRGALGPPPSRPAEPRPSAPHAP